MKRQERRRHRVFLRNCIRLAAKRGRAVEAARIYAKDQRISLAPPQGGVGG